MFIFTVGTITLTVSISVGILWIIHKFNKEFGGDLKKLKEGLTDD